MVEAAARVGGVGCWGHHLAGWRGVRFEAGQRHMVTWVIPGSSGDGSPVQAARDSGLWWRWGPVQAMLRAIMTTTGAGGAGEAARLPHRPGLVREHGATSAAACNAGVLRGGARRRPCSEAAGGVRGVCGRAGEPGMALWSAVLAWVSRWACLRSTCGRR